MVQDYPKISKHIQTSSLEDWMKVFIPGHSQASMVEQKPHPGGVAMEAPC